MAKGLPGADSSVLVTSMIGGKTLVDLANDLFGRMPAIWGRYFGGWAEYRHLKENQLLRNNNIRVVPLAQQTKRVSGTFANGSTDAAANAEDVINTFGAAYLASLGGKVLMFLDVEGSPSLSAAYYRGWAQNLVAHSQSFSSGTVTLLPCVYATQGDDPTWNAVASAVAQGATCNGAWIARWRHKGCAALPDFDPQIVQPRVHIPCDVLIWQYANDCHGSNGIDCDEINPDPNIQATVLAQSILPPDTPVA
jgi:hypothetical protein